jgi:hypothetical protein
MIRRRLVTVLVTLMSAAMLHVSPGAHATVRTEPGDETAAAGLSLAAYVPAEHRYTCSLVDPTEPGALGEGEAAAATSIEVSLQCTPPDDGVYGGHYTKFTSTAAMQAAYDAYVLGGATVPATGDLSSCPAQNTWRYKGEDQGLLACYVGTDGRADLVWTTDSLALLGTAVAPDTDPTKLLAWWKTSAGPALGGLDGIPDKNTQFTSPAAANRALLRHVPRPIRPTCGALDLSDPDAAGADYRYRLFIAAEVVCHPKAGADTVYYELMDPDAMTPEQDAQYGPQLPDPLTRHQIVNGFGCPDARSDKQDGKTVGTFLCAVPTKGAPGADDGAALLGWTNDRLGIRGTAIRDDGDAKALLTWWRHGDRAGPI